MRRGRVNFMKIKKKKKKIQAGNIIERETLDSEMR